VQGARLHQCHRTGAGVVMLRGWHRPPPRSAPAPPPLLSLPGAAKAERKRGHGWLGLRAAASGFLWGGLRACNAGPDAEGGKQEERIPRENSSVTLILQIRCPASVPRPRGAHPAAAARGRVCGAGGRGVGEKGACAGGYAGLSRSGVGARAGW
jgi:hypothetical protein